MSATSLIGNHMTADPIVILSYARTPMGSFQGALAGASATDLGAAAVGAAVERSGVDANAIDKIYMGCVLPAGLGQAPARQAALKAGLPLSVEATTVNKMCGSGMQAAIMAADTLSAGSADIVIAGGMESMTNAPYLLTKHRGGARIGHDVIKDSMFLDGLEDAYEPGRAMGSFAEETAGEYQFTRAAQDDYAVASLTRAQAAQSSGAFDREIVAVEVKDRKGSIMVDKDEQPLKGDASKIPSLKPAFAKDGTITAANASSISDGAAALVLTRQSVADKLGLEAGRADRRARRARAGARQVHHRAGRRDDQGARQGGLERRRCRSVRGQRGVRLRRDDRDARPRHQPRQDQRPWRRDRARPSDRRERRAAAGDLDLGAANARRHARPGVALHRRRRGHRGRGRTGLN